MKYPLRYKALEQSGDLGKKPLKPYIPRIIG